MSITRLVITDTSPAAAGTAVSAATLGGLGRFDALSFFVTITGATGGTIDVYLQTSFDGGTTWYDYAHFAQSAAAAAAVTKYFAVPNSDATGLTTVGKGTLASPGVALAASTILGGAWGDLMRAVYVAGASTSAGATQTIAVVGYQSRT